MKYGTKAAARRAFIAAHATEAEGKAALYALEKLCPGGPWIKR